MAETQNVLNPVSDGPWSCSKCGKVFTSWMGFVRHGRIQKHFTQTETIRLARKKYVDTKLYRKRNTDYNKNEARDARRAANSQPVVAKTNHVVSAELYWVSMQRFEDGVLMILRPRSRDETLVYYAVPASLKFDMPKPKVS